MASASSLVCPPQQRRLKLSSVACRSSEKRSVCCSLSLLTSDGGFWDFTADMSKGDLAYSNESLPAHTDTAYFTDPAGLQIFHCLSHPIPPGSGGETLLVDGFYAAQTLAIQDESAYATLSRLAVPYHASGNAGNLLRPPVSQPVLRHDHMGELQQVRWNNEDRSVLGEGWTPTEVREWYEAARAYQDILTNKDTEYWVKLSPGTVVGELHDGCRADIQSLTTGESCTAVLHSPGRDGCVAPMLEPMTGAPDAVRCWKRQRLTSTAGRRVGRNIKLQHMHAQKSEPTRASPEQAAPTKH